MVGPKIDVLMPVYNAASYLKATIASIQAQTVEDFRLIAVDDGSMDESLPILIELAAADPRIIVVEQANGGIVAALNTGLAYCEAPYLARHDADDLSDPDRFETELAYLEAHPRCVAVSARARHIDRDGRALGTLSTLKDPTRANPAAYPAIEPYVLQPMLMVRMDAVRAIGGYRPLEVAEDSDLYWRLTQIGELHNLDDCLGSYRMHEGSISSASIVRGRQAAIWSQLAALSAQRVRAGRVDVTFDDALLRRMREAQALSAMFSVAALQTTDTERRWLALSVSAKLLELCYYRPFEPERSDIRFIRWAAAYNEAIVGTPACTVFREARLSAALRLLQSGRWRDALDLTGARGIPHLMARAAFRLGLPDAVRDRIKALRKR